MSLQFLSSLKSLHSGDRLVYTTGTESTHPMDRASTESIHTPWWQPVLFAGMAGGLGWGIRGQYGHEAGAMIAGVLVSLTLTHLLCPGVSTMRAVRAVALATVAMGFGGTMTYGQTVGLTHDQELIGNLGAFRWGMLGLSIKGGIWIGLAGFLLGLGLGGKRYNALDMFKLVLLMLFATLVGWSILNRPHDPANLRLPYFYFSDHWQWEPALLEKPDHKYRPEVWGGLLFALAAATVYASRVKGDTLARNMALWGFLGGALGFPLGQCLQATNAWNPGFFRESFTAPFTNYFNWWNMMETGFGTVMGAVLGLGLWLNRARIDVAADAGDRPIPYWLEGLLLALHIPLLVVAIVAQQAGKAVPVYDLGIVMGFIPLVACIRGRYWPYLQILPITLLPIAGITFQMCGGGANAERGMAFSLLFLLPMLSATALALWSARRASLGDTPRTFIRDALLLTTWTYFWLNHTFFDFPWPWLPWGGRTANGLIFTVYALGLTAMVYINRNRSMPRGSG